MLKKAATLILLLSVAFGVMLLSTRSATFIVQDSLALKEDPARVWQVLQDVGAWPRWWPGVETARLGSSWAEGEQLELVFKGNPAAGPARIDQWRVGQEIAFSRDGVLGSRAGTSLQLESQPGVVLVTVESVVRGPQAFLARFTGREAFSAYHQRLLAGLAKQARQYDFSGAAKEPAGGR